MSKTITVIKNEVKGLKEKLDKLENEYDNCRHSPREVEVQILIANADKQVRALENLLTKMEEK